jgi:putative ATPase
MLEGGEDPKFIARRMVIFASEDVGNADPRGLQVAVAVKEAVEFVGMPEARISLAQAVTYLAVAAKSRAAYDGIEAAIEEVKKSGSIRIEKGHRHLPTELKGARYYHPKDVGLEKQIKEKLDRINPDFDLNPR